MDGKFERLVNRLLRRKDKNDRIPNIAFILRLDSYWILTIFLLVHVLIVSRAVESDVMEGFLAHTMTYIHSAAAIASMFLAKWLKKTVSSIFGINLTNPEKRFSTQCKIKKLFTPESFEIYQKKVYKSLTSRWINYSILLSLFGLTLPNYIRILTESTYHIYLWDLPSSNSILGISNAIIYPLYSTLFFGMVLPLGAMLFMLIRCIGRIGKEEYSLELRTFSELDRTSSLLNLQQQEELVKFSIKRFKRLSKILPNIALKYSLITAVLALGANYALSYYINYFSNLNDVQMVMFLFIALILLDILMIVTIVSVFLIPQRALRNVIDTEKKYRINSLEEMYEEYRVKYYVLLRQRSNDQKAISNLADTMRTIEHMIQETNKILSWPFNYKQGITVLVGAIAPLISALFTGLSYLGIV